MTPPPAPTHVIHEAVNSVGARIQREWLRRVMAQTQTTPLTDTAPRGVRQRKASGQR